MKQKFLKQHQALSFKCFELGRLSLGIAGLAVFLWTFGLTVGADLLDILCMLMASALVDIKLPR